MKQIYSFVLPQEKIDYLNQKYKLNKVENNSPYVLSAYKIGTNSVTLYNSFKIVVQGINAFDIASELGYKEETWDLNYTHIGSDEVGTGDFFGPIIVASALVKEDQIEYLKEIGVNDSKKLSDKFIINTVPLLLKKFPHCIKMLDNETYNKYNENSYNMNKLKALLHKEALEDLSNKYKVKEFVIDQFCPENKYYEYTNTSKNTEYPIVFITKGESHSASVALASMIARYAFLSKINELEKKYNLSIPLGANTNVELLAKKLLEEKGIDYLRKIAKVNFKTIKK